MKTTPTYLTNYKGFGKDYPGWNAIDCIRGGRSLNVFTFEMVRGSLTWLASVLI